MAGKIHKIRIGHLSTLYHTALILQGLDWVENKLGIAADWRLFGGGPDIIRAFSREEIDIGYVGLPPAVIGITNGVPIKCIGGGHMEGTVLVGGRHESSLAESGDIKEVLLSFADGIIGCPPKRSIHDIIIRDLIRNLGSGKRTCVRNYAWADLIVEDLAAKKLSAAVGTPALAVAAQHSAGTHIIIPPNRLWPNNPSYGIITHASLIKKEPALLREFLILHEDASNLIRNDPQQAAEIVSEVVQIVDKGFVLETYRISPRYCASLPQAFIDASLGFVPALQQLKYITLELGVDDLFDLSLIEDVHAEDPHY